jgi:ketopantoate reductase
VCEYSVCLENGTCLLLLPYDALLLHIYIDEIWVRTEKAGPYKSSTVLDLVSGAPLEMRYLFGVPLERAR